MVSLDAVEWLGLALIMLWVFAIGMLAGQYIEVRWQRTKEREEAGLDRYQRQVDALVPLAVQHDEQSTQDFTAGVN